LLHLIRIVLAVQRNVHRGTWFLQVGVHAFDGDKHGRGINLVRYKAGDVGWAPDQARHLGFNIVLFEEATFQRYKVGQGGTHREDADPHFVLSGCRNSGEQRGRQDADCQRERRFPRYTAHLVLRFASLCCDWYAPICTRVHAVPAIIA
jgi:hypothetical protein